LNPYTALPKDIPEAGCFAVAPDAEEAAPSFIVPEKGATVEGCRKTTFAV